ncbi:MAG: hypothetical protein AAF222_12580 [Pseudomonadota bacterium]
MPGSTVKLTKIEPALPYGWLSLRIPDCMCRQSTKNFLNGTPKKRTARKAV